MPLSDVCPYFTASAQVTLQQGTPRVTAKAIQLIPRSLADFSLQQRPCAAFAMASALLWQLPVLWW